MICNALCRKVGLVEMKEGIELCQKYDGTSMKSRYSRGDIGITEATLGLKPEKTEGRFRERNDFDRQFSKVRHKG